MAGGFLTSLDKRFEIMFILLVILGSLMLCAALPVYFRGDDALMLDWVSSYPSVLDNFRPDRVIPDMNEYRPFRNAAFWLLFRFFRLDPFPYQLLIVLTYGFSLFFYFKTAEVMADRRTAYLALLIYIAAFHFLGYIIFYFSDIHFVLELFFIHLSLFLLIRAITGGRILLPGVICFIFALLSKDPSALVVPAVIVGFVFSRRKELDPPGMRKGWTAAAAVTVIGLAFLVFSPVSISRPGLLKAGDPGAMVRFFYLRWNYYARTLAVNPGYVIVPAAVFQGLMALSRRKKSRGSVFACAAIAVLAAIAARTFPPAALAMMVLFALAGLLRTGTHIPATLWFLVPLAGLMVIPNMTRTYLTEASYGMALVTAMMLSGVLGFISIPRLKRGRIVLAASAVVVIIAAILLPVLLRKVIEPLKTVQSARQSFRSCIEYTFENLDHPGNRLVVLNAEDLGDEDFRSHKYWSNDMKASRMQTMDTVEVGKFIRLVGAEHLEVTNMAALDRTHAEGNTYLMAMNEREKKLIVSSGHRVEIEHNCGAGRSSSCIFRLMEE